MIIFGLTACSSKPYVVKEASFPVILEQEKVNIYVVRHGWHTGIVVPAYNILNQLPELKKGLAIPLY